MDPEKESDDQAVLEAKVIARMEPQQKMDLVERAQAEGTAVVLCLGLLLLAVYFRPLGQLLDTAVIPAGAWMLVVGLSLIPLVCSQITLEVMKRRG